MSEHTCYYTWEMTDDLGNAVYWLEFVITYQPVPRSRATATCPAEGGFCEVIMFWLKSISDNSGMEEQCDHYSQTTWALEHLFQQSHDLQQICAEDYNEKQEPKP